VTLEVTVDLKGTLLEMEGAIQEASNAVGHCATEEALKRFDTDGSPIRVGALKLTARGRDPKPYQTPYGVVEIERYVYQTSRGGRIYCPLEQQARIIRGATPLFASQISHKYAQLNARAVQTDLAQNHGRKIATSYIQHVAEWVGDIAAAKEEDWEYQLPRLAGGIATVVASLDGAMIPMADSDGWREAMVGTLSFYDHDGERQHTLYLAAAPEYGKHAFTERFAREIARAKHNHPEARWLGIADGAPSNWAFLEQHTQRQLIDFFQASEYNGQRAQARWPQRHGVDPRAAGASIARWSSRRGSCAVRRRASPASSATSTHSSTRARCRRTWSRTTRARSPPRTSKTSPSGWATLPRPKKRTGSTNCPSSPAASPPSPSASTGR
jgi:hypothetical protein